VNYNTIARAYLELDRDGVISTQRGRGTFVAGVPDEEQMARKRSRKLHAVVRSALDEAHLLGYEPREIAEVFEEELADWQERNGTETVKNG
jgi:GntR family transcriptional regulator